MPKFRRKRHFEGKRQYKQRVSTSTKTYLQSHNQDELDPKTIDFAILVTLLQPTFIMEYLHKILNFLNSNLCEMNFPCITPCKEEFLLRIAKDNVFLKCSMFTAESQMIGKNILKVLHENRHRYKWEYVYTIPRQVSTVPLSIHIICSIGF